jgi:hypothetical protein
MGRWGKTNETFCRPRSTLSDVPVEWSQYRILGDPGTQRSRWVIMAVQWFSRFRANWGKRLSEAGSLMQIVEKINEIDAYELPGATALKGRVFNNISIDISLRMCDVI